MKNLLGCISIFLISILNAQAPGIEWQKFLGGSDHDAAWSIQQTSEGGYIMAGYSYSNDGDVSGNHEHMDYWIVKLDASGSIQWQKSLGGSNLDWANSIQQTSDGGYIVAGESYSEDGDISDHHNNSDFWIVKLDVSGGIQWEKSLGGSSGDHAKSIQQTLDGGYIVAGYSWSNDGDVSINHGNGDVWVVKLDTSGSIEWQKCLGGSNSEMAHSIKQTADGGYIMAGESSSNDGDVSGNHGGKDFWVVKLDASGSIEWQKSLGGSGITDIAWSIQQTSDGGYIVAGQSNSSDGDISGNHGDSDFWIVKLDTSGSIQWEKSLGGSSSDIALSIQQTPGGGYIMAGHNASHDGDVDENFGGFDFWVVKLNSSGNIQWQKVFGDSKADYANSIQQTFDGGYIVAGYGFSVDSDDPNLNIRIVKFKSDGDISVNEQESSFFEVYPNPYSDKLFIKSTTNESVVKIQIFDLSGKLLIQKEGNQKSDFLLLEDSLPPGTYLLRVYTDKSVRTFKIIKKPKN